jgi:two-component system cell cycle sensor histidine kinase/response regulator CckA
LTPQRLNDSSRIDYPRQHTLGTPMRAAIVYFAAGLVWIFVGDALAGEFFTVQTVKGSIFVLGSASLLWFLLARGQRRLALAEEGFRALVEQNISGIYVLTLEGRVRYVNPRGCEMLGYTLDELRAMPTILQIVEPEDQELVRQRLTARAEPGAREERHTFRLRSASGRVLHIEIEGATRRSEKGPVLIGTMVDVSAQRESDRALHESEELFRTVVNTASEGLCVLDAHDRITYVNPRLQELVPPPGATPGRPGHEIVVPDDRRNFARIIDACRSGSTTRNQLTVIGRNGIRIPCEFSCAPLNDDGSYEGTVMLITDVSERLAAERERLQMRQQFEDISRLRALGRLASGVAHEFNNVLMGIQPFIDVIRRRSGEDEKIRTATDQINKAIARGRQITGDIRTFARSEEPATRNLPVREWLDGLRDELAGTLGESIEVGVGKVDADLAIQADPAQLRQVLDHLATNARDAMVGGGTLTFGARRAEPGEEFAFGVLPQEGLFVHLTIADTGDGIPESELTKIFEPLFTTKGRGSTGLGLAIAHHLVTRNRGYLFAESRQGIGTTFHLFLPSVQPLAEA